MGKLQDNLRDADDNPAKLATLYELGIINSNGEPINNYMTNNSCSANLLIIISIAELIWSMFFMELIQIETFTFIKIKFYLITWR